MSPLTTRNLAHNSRVFFRLLRRQSTQASHTQPHPRLEKLNARLPGFLHRYTTPLLTAPVAHISSFLLLHELTAVIPLFSLAGFFHYSQWMPPFISEGKWVADGVAMFGSWFRKRGWLGDISTVGADGTEGKMGRRGIWWSRGEGSVRIVVEFATAYAITKALLPLRLMFSVWATPWFAKVSVIPVVNLTKKIFGRRHQLAPQKGSPVAAVANVAPKVAANKGKRVD